MSTVERKVLIPDGDTTQPHQHGVCAEALYFRNRVLEIEEKNGRRPFGRVSRRQGEIKGCLVEFIPRNEAKKI